MTRNATYFEIGGAVALLLLGSALYERTTRRDDTKLATLHTHTVVTKVIAAQAETTYRNAKMTAAEKRAIYRAVRDSALHDLRDTSLTKRALASADVAITHDTITITKADTVIQKVKDVATATDAELHEASKPAPIPRLRYTVAALYDPLSGTMSGSGGVALHVISGLSLTARVEQSLALGEKPAVRVGISLAF